MESTRDLDRARSRTDWRNVALELLPLAAPPLLVVFGLGVLVACASGIGWIRAGRLDVGVPLLVLRAMAMAGLFLYIVVIGLTEGADQRPLVAAVYVLGAVWAIVPIVSAVLLARVTRGKAVSGAHGIS